MEEKTRREFFMTIGFLIVFSLFCTLSGYVLDTVVAEKKPYEFKRFELDKMDYGGETGGSFYVKDEQYVEFISRVLTFASKQTVWDVTYFKTPLGKGWTVTQRRPEVIFFQDKKTALVWWFCGYAKYQKTPEQIRKMLKEREKELGNENCLKEKIMNFHKKH